MPSAPTRIHLEFSLWLYSRTTLTVTGPDGVVPLGQPHLVGGLAAQDLPPGLPNGDYTVLYFADFGLLGSASGAIDFAVEPAPSATTSSRTRPTATPSRRTSAPSRTDRPSPTTTGTATGTATEGTSGGSGSVPPSPVTVPGTDTTTPTGTPTVSTAATDEGEWPWPPPLVLAGLLAATGAFGVDRWRTVRGNRTRAHRASTDARPR